MCGLCRRVVRVGPQRGGTGGLGFFWRSWGLHLRGAVLLVVWLRLLCFPITGVVRVDSQRGGTGDLGFF